MGFAPRGELYGTVGGLMFGALFILTEIKLRQISLRNLSAAVFGLAFGFFVAWILTRILSLTQMDEGLLGVFQIVFTLVFCYMGMAISIKGKDEFNLIIPYVRFSREEQDDKLYLVEPMENHLTTLAIINLTFDPLSVIEIRLFYYMHHHAITVWIIFNSHPRVVS